MLPAPGGISGSVIEGVTRLWIMSESKFDIITPLATLEPPLNITILEGEGSLLCRHITSPLSVLAQPLSLNKFYY